MKKTNECLKKLYESRWDKLIHNGKGKGAAHPLLIKVADEYDSSDYKIMIFGQETYGWHGDLGDGNIDIEGLMKDYKGFFYGENAGRERLKKKNKRAFFNRRNFKFFQEEIKVDGKKIAFIWNNLAKIGNSQNSKHKGKGRQTKQIKDIEKEYFNLLDDELNILDPDIVIFRTGNRYIPSSSSKKLTKDSPVSIVKLDKHPDIFAIKAYHPSAYAYCKNVTKIALELVNKNI